MLAQNSGLLHSEPTEAYRYSSRAVQCTVEHITNSNVMEGNQGVGDCEKGRLGPGMGLTGVQLVAGSPGYL